jgi:hypothetical protein
LSPAKLNTRLQGDFVRTELETGHRMLALAMDQRTLHEDDAAVQSLSLSRVALSGAERHLATVKLPRVEAKELLRDVRELGRRIEGFESARGNGRAPRAKRSRQPIRAK